MEGSSNTVSGVPLTEKRRLAGRPVPVTVRLLPLVNPRAFDNALAVTARDVMEPDALVVTTVFRDAESVAVAPVGPTDFERALHVVEGYDDDLAPAAHFDEFVVLDDGRARDVAQDHLAVQERHGARQSR